MHLIDSNLELFSNGTENNETHPEILVLGNTILIALMAAISKSI
jgi:hypothetical protein